MTALRRELPGATGSSRPIGDGCAFTLTGENRMDIGLVTGTITSLRFAGDIAKSFLSLRSMEEVQGKVIELQSAILSAQASAMEANSQQLTMAEEIRALQSQIESMKGWREEGKRYKLVEPWGN
jgi:hypothetical protein